jgi:hypothetical protein
VAVRSSLAGVSANARFVNRPIHAASAQHGASWRLMRRAITVLLVSSFGAGTALAADASLPNEPLHGVKLATEEMRLGFAQAPDQRVAVLLDIAEARLTEAKELQAGHRDAEADAAVSAYAERVAEAAVHVEEQAAEAPAAAERFRSDVRMQQAGIPSAATAPASSVAIALELRPTLERSRQAAPHEIAAAAAVVADKAATSVEQRVVPAAANTAPAVVPTTAREEQQVVPAAIVVEHTVVPAATGVEPTVVPSSAAQTPPSTSDARSTPSVPAASITTTTADSAPPARPAATAQEDSASQKQSAEEAKKTETAAKAARESAERAKHAAEQAKQSASKNARDKAK